MFPAILIVDDDETDRYLIRRLIRKGKLAEKVFEANSGEEALAFFADRERQEREHPGLFPPLLVLLDINMPLMNGFEFLDGFQPVRSRHNYSSVVFMMFTSSERAEERERALAYDCVKGFITKMPRDASELRAKLSSLMPA